jgi:hypothetical protein
MQKCNLKVFFLFLLDYNGFELCENWFFKSSKHEKTLNLIYDKVEGTASKINLKKICEGLIFWFKVKWNTEIGVVLIEIDWVVGERERDREREGDWKLEKTIRRVWCTISIHGKSKFNHKMNSSSRAQHVTLAPK